jgi:pantothenate synthetase
MFLPAGTRGYDDLRNGARRERIAGVTVAVAALADVIRSKEAANREKDNMQLPVLRRTLEQIRVRENEQHRREQG